MPKYTRSLFVAVILTLSVFSSVPTTRAADKAPNPELVADVQPALQKIKAKIQASGDSKPDLTDNLKELDGLITKYKTKDADGASGIAMLKVQIYMQVLEDDDKAAVTLTQIKKDFPGTKAASVVDSALAQIKASAEANKIQRTLVPGTKFPDFSERDVAGQPLSIANYKGKVVLIDFWATWCGPCVHELPNVRDTYGKHHSQGFEIIGISLDSDQSKLTNFVKAQNVTWQQFFDGNGWSNKLAQKYGIHSIPATFLLDGNGVIIGRDLRAEELEAAVTKALAKK